MSMKKDDILNAKELDFDEPETDDLENEEELSDEELPDDDTRLSELEFIFNSEHESNIDSNYEQEAKDLLIRYQKETKKQKVSVLTKYLDSLDEESDEYLDTLRQIQEIQQET